MPIQVLVDFDDTLYHYTDADKHACEQVFHYLAQHHNILDAGLIYKTIVKEIKASNNISNKHNKAVYFKKVLEKLNIPCSVLGHVMLVYDTCFDEKLRLLDGVLQFLQHLRDNCIEVGIVSNNQYVSQYRKLVKLGIAGLVSHITTTDEVGEEKPHPFVFAEACRKFQHTKEDVIRVMIGDNFGSDIQPCFSFNILPFLLTDTETTARGVWKDTWDGGHHYFRFTDFHGLDRFFQDWIHAMKELTHWSLFYSQSFWCVQGSGGNISVKFDNSSSSMVIKPSGMHMGDMTNMRSCLMSGHTNMLVDKTPSMEYGFHAWLPTKYVVHLHLIPANLFLCAQQDGKDAMWCDLPLSHQFIEYHAPGEPLCQAIQHKIETTRLPRVLFLENHGIILLSNEADQLYQDTFTLLHYFVNKTFLVIPYDHVLETYHSIRHRLGNRYLFPVADHILHDIHWEYLHNISCFFPDMAVFFQKTSCLGDDNEEEIGDLVLDNMNHHVYIVATSISKSYIMREILETYCLLLANIKQPKKIEVQCLRRDPKEIHRRNL